MYRYYYDALIAQGTVEELIRELHHRWPTVTVQTWRKVNRRGETSVKLSCPSLAVLRTAVRFLCSDEGMPDPATFIYKAKE